jgi:hypothetical protein
VRLAQHAFDGLREVFFPVMDGYDDGDFQRG